MQQNSLSKKIFWGMAFIGLFPLLIMSVPGYYWIIQDLEHVEKEHLSAVLESRYSGAIRIFDGLQEDFFTARSSNCLKGLCESRDPPLGENPQLCHVLEALRNREDYYKALFAYDAKWQIIATSKNSPSNFTPASSLKKKLRLNNDLTVDNDLNYNEDSVIAQVGQSFRERNSTIYIVAILDLSQFVSSLVNDESGLGKSGKIYVLSGNGRYIAPPKDSTGLLGKKSRVAPGLVSWSDSSVMRYRDWRGVSVLGVSERFPQIGMLMVAEIDEAEVFELPRHLLLSAGIVGIFTLVIVFFVSIMSSKNLSASLRKLSLVAKLISEGNYNERAPEFADKETQEVGKTFNQMLDRLEISQRAVVNTASLAAVGELSSSIAHEMKSPLSSIKINLQALRKKVAADETYLEMADISLQQIHRLEMMLSELLHYSKPLHLQPESLSFDILSEEVMHTVGQNIEQKGLILVVEDLLGGVKLHVDPELMVRALTGLIDNAVQWSPPGGRIILSGRKLSGKKSWVSMQVTDEGPGINERHRKRLFQPFFTTRPEGTGLGLTNVKKIVEQHGGMVFAEKNVSRGAVFTIHLPSDELAA